MDTSAVVKILDISYDKALNGVAGMKGAADLATDYMAHGGDLEAQVDALDNVKYISQIQFHKK
ncbi:hypothetical protein [Megasphaera sp.]|uniref:hypothetical protein n=1 Tax=Megasphaera sp. TaxID=2023260 RepID=UPI00257F0B28|nr:hypothetical protein [Megasphaera sp.]